MSASFVASFFMIIAALVVAAIEQSTRLTGDVMIDCFIFLSIICNIMFFYSFGVISERDGEYQKFIGAKRRHEWPLRVLSHTVLLFLPISLEFGTSAFVLSLFVFYVTLLSWDAVVFRGRRDQLPVSLSRSPVIYDVFGACAWLLMSLGIASYYVQVHKDIPGWLSNFLTTNLDTNRTGFLLGTGFALYVGVAIAAVWQAKNLFRQAFRTVY